MIENNITIAIQNYRAIEKAVMKFRPGISFLVGGNTMGKSTSIKAMKTLLDGNYGDSTLPRHGTDGFDILMKIGNSKIRVSRKGNQTYLKYNDEPEVSKLGRGSLSKLEPRFPLKREDYLDSVFYPNFSFQNEVPLFKDISVFDLFSSMFSSVARVSQHVDGLHKQQLVLSREVQDQEANVKYLKADLLNKEDEVSRFNSNHPNVQDEYNRASAANSLQVRLNELTNQINGYESTHDVRTLEALSNKVESAQALFPILDSVTEMEPSVAKLVALNSALASLKKLPDVDLELTEKGYNYQELQNQLEEVKRKLQSIPDVELVEMAEKCKNLREKLSTLSVEYESIKSDYDKAFEELKKLGCPYRMQGICPEGE